MGLDELYLKLKEAYTDWNLNKITSKIIGLQQNKCYGQVRGIVNRISGYVIIDEEKDAKCFVKLIMLYHPDKGESIRKKLDEYYAKKDFDSLNTFSHILYVGNLDDIPVTTVDSDIDYSPEYGWDDYDQGNFSVIDPYSDGTEDYVEDHEIERTFFNAVKLRIYGDIEQDFPTYYLEDFEDIELSSSAIEFLDGVEFCKHVVVMDLSDNAISDISDLWNLRRIEELYLSDNQLELIDPISNLLNLRVLDLSNNQVCDISPLFRLENLEFVNLIGNRIPVSQLNTLRQKGVMVMHESF